jgi:hypothetical protein
MIAVTKKEQPIRRRRRSAKTKIPVYKTMPYPRRAAGPVQASAKPTVQNRVQALRHLTVLLAAFEEVEGFDPLRLRNQPPPALWIDDTSYLNDMKSLLVELRELRALLLDDKAGHKTQAGKRVIATVVVAATRFIESYADGLGKGAAALTIGAAGALLFHIGVGKDVLGSIWDHLRLGK